MYFHLFALASSALPLALGWPDAAVVPSTAQAATMLAIAACSFGGAAMGRGGAGQGGAAPRGSAAGAGGATRAGAPPTCAARCAPPACHPAARPPPPGPIPVAIGNLLVNRAFQVATAAAKASAINFTQASQRWRRACGVGGGGVL